MSAVAEALTMDDAVAVLADDHDAGALVPQTQDVTDFVDDGTLVSEQPSDGLSMSDAVALLDDREATNPNRPSELVITPQHPIAMVDGKTMTLNDLVQGYAIGRDLKDFIYGVDSQYQQAMDAARAVAQNAEALAGYLTANMPPAPDPLLSRTDPAEYVRMQAQHEGTFTFVEQIIDGGNRARQQMAEMERQQRANAIDREMKLLIHHFPECADGEGREQFFDTMRSVAYQCDFTEQELRQVIDHRIFRLAHLASLGIDAEAAGERKAESRRQQQRKRRARSGNAMERLEQSGSLDDAMAVDFE